MRVLHLHGRTFTLAVGYCTVPAPCAYYTRQHQPAACWHVRTCQCAYVAAPLWPWQCDRRLACIVISPQCKCKCKVHAGAADSLRRASLWFCFCTLHLHARRPFYRRQPCAVLVLYAAKVEGNLTTRSLSGAYRKVHSHRNAGFDSGFVSGYSVSAPDPAGGASYYSHSHPRRPRHRRKEQQE
jgi:hypothetical protein